MFTSTSKDHRIGVLALVAAGAMVAPSVEAGIKRPPTEPGARALGSRAETTGVVTVPILKPGSVLALDSPTFDGGCETGLGSYLATCNVPSVIEAPLGGRVRAELRFRRSRYDLRQHYDFGVDAGDREGALIWAQVVAHVDVRGFLLLVGLGQVDSEVVFRLIDITDGESDAVCVKEVQLSRHELVGSMNAGIAFSFKIEAGAPYAGAGVDPGVSFDYNLSEELVRDAADVAFDALVRRGGRYRVELQATASARIGELPGFAAASFTPLFGAGTPEGIIDKEHWLEQLGPFQIPEVTLVNKAFLAPKPPCPDGDTVGTCAGDDELECEVDADCPFGKRPCNTPPYTCTTIDVLEYLDVPTSVGGLVDRIKAKREEALDDLQELPVPDPGVHLSNLVVSLQEDHVEVLENRDLDDKLAICETRASVFLPKEFGGKLERVFAIVERMVDGAERGGLDVSNAEDYLSAAHNSAGRGAYKQAYQYLCTAYDRAQGR